MWKGGECMSEIMYEIKAVAKELHLSYRGVLNMIKQGRINAVKIGKRYLVSAEELERIKKEGA
jgi:excisionase family DNA binding protein